MIALKGKENKPVSASLVAVLNTAGLLVHTEGLSAQRIINVALCQFPSSCNCRIGMNKLFSTWEFCFSCVVAFLMN